MEQESINNSTDKDISDSESSSTDTPINISTKILAVTNSDNLDDVSFEKQETLLSSARNGNINIARQLLKASAEGNISLDVNCKGTSKHNLGWTPLQLASYFGHYQMVELLLQNGASINMVNRDGDTALHKAAFIGRSDLVLVLLQNNADVNIINGEGQTAKDVAKTSDISEMISAAELAEVKNKENQLLDAAKEGDVFMLNKLLKEEKPPNINCTDAQGNSCLHCASYRGHKETAVLLLQNGIDTTIKNNRGQTALDLARDAQMHQVLNVRPIRQLQKTVARFEGQLLKLSRFLGWKLVWVVLERGVLTYFNSRADATSGVKRKDFKYLDEARVTPLESDSSSFIIHFSDATLHKLSIVSDGQVPGQITRQKWINALIEHAEFSSHYLGVGAGIDNTDDEDIRETGELGETAVKPLGSMQDTLQTAAAHLSLLETQVQESVALVEALDQLCPATGGLPASAVMRFQHVCKTAEDMVGALTHCLSVVRQQEEIREARLRVERDKCRVLEEALMLLARQHHALELSVSASASAIDLHNVPSRHSRYFDAPTPDDEFYDAFEADSETDTLVTAMAPISPSSDTDTLVGIPSPTSSCTTLLSSGGHAYHCARDYSQHNKIAKNLRQSLPVPMFSRNDFSIWSVLKNCIGKELSKITMPVIFNEPLSFLQRMVEYMEYAELLRKASEQSDPISRIQYVAAFAVSALASNWERLGKPFNPLLGETYELEREEFRIICEQVSHHPPVSAFHSDSKDWIFHGSIHPKLKFWGKSVEIQPKGTVTVELPKWGEAYTWSNVNCCVHNIIVGRLWMEQYGTMEVINHKTGHRAVLTFKPAGWNSKDLHRVDGFITDKSKNKLFYLYGKWTEFIKCTDVCSYEEYVKENAHKFKRDGEGRSKSPNDSPSHTPRKVLAKLNSLKVGPFKSNSVQESVDEPTIPEPLDGEVPKSDSTYSIDIPNSVALWQARPRPPNSSDFYQFTTFAMSLNEMEVGMDKALCPTDSRLRPDIRKLEQGDIDGAAVEKTRLEEKQRDARKSRRGKKGEEWAPRWFCQGTNPYTKQDDWLYSGGYWDRNYSEDPEIF